MEDTINDEVAQPTTTEAPAILADHVENSTDATRGEPLAVRAEKRKLELQKALAELGANDQLARSDIELAVASINILLTGDVDHLSHATAAQLSRVLEGCKHIAEVAPRATEAEPVRNDG